jgi:hypothetical protein
LPPIRDTSLLCLLLTTGLFGKKTSDHNHQEGGKQQDI